jgi:RpiB/LacA/LacB family sugar-phosphate isomerase
MGAHESIGRRFSDIYYSAAQKLSPKTAGRSGGSGNGEAMAANKVKGMRCALAHSVETAELARAHNDANGISFGAHCLEKTRHGHAQKMAKRFWEKISEKKR